MILLSAGHGGIKDGRYVTAGKRGRIISGGYKDNYIFEGVANRLICSMIQFMAMRDGVLTELLSDEIHDTRRSTKIAREKELSKRFETVLLEVHFNATRLHNGHGFEVFVSNNSSDRSKKFAERIIMRVKRDLGLKVRREYSSVHTWYKIRDFDMIALTSCPAVLVEGGFMDNELDQPLILDMNWMRDLSSAYYYSALDVLEINK